MFGRKRKHTGRQESDSPYQAPARFGDARAMCACGTIWHMSGECDPAAYNGLMVEIPWPCKDCSGEFTATIPSNTRRDTIVADKWRGVPFVTLNVKNDRNTPLQLCIEPWASIYSVPPHATYKLHLKGVPHLSGPTIEISGDGLLTVYPECGFELRHNDTLIDEAP